MPVEFDLGHESGPIEARTAIGGAGFGDMDGEAGGAQGHARIRPRSGCGSRDDLYGGAGSATRLSLKARGWTKAGGFRGRGPPRWARRSGPTTLPSSAS